MDRNFTTNRNPLSDISNVQTECTRIVSQKKFDMMDDLNCLQPLKTKPKTIPEVTFPPSPDHDQLDPRRRYIPIRVAKENMAWKGSSVRSHAVGVMP